MVHDGEHQYDELDDDPKCTFQPARHPNACESQSPGLDAFTSFYVILYAILYAILYVRFTQGLDASTQGLDASTLPWSDSMLRQRKG